MKPNSFHVLLLGVTLWPTILPAEEKPSPGELTEFERILIHGPSAPGIPDREALLDARRNQVTALRQFYNQVHSDQTLYEAPAVQCRKWMLTFVDRAGKPYAHGCLAAAQYAISKSSLIASTLGECLLPGRDEKAKFTVVERFGDDDLVLLKLDVRRQGPRASFKVLQPGEFVVASSSTHKVVEGVVSVSERPIDQLAPPSLRRTMYDFERKMRVPVNRRRKGFRVAFETDMDLAYYECGAPVVDLRGRMVGMALARSASHSTLVLPSRRIAELIYPVIARERRKHRASHAWSTSLGAH